MKRAARTGTAWLAAVALAGAMAIAILPVAAAGAATLPPLARSAAADLLRLERERLQDSGSTTALRSALLRGAAAVRTERLRANRDGDPLLDTSIDDNLALLLQLRLLEAIAFHLRDDTAAMRWASAGDSLVAALVAQPAPYPRGDTAILALLAGFAPPRSESAVVADEVRARWQQTSAVAIEDPVELLFAAEVAAALESGPLASPKLDGMDGSTAIVARALASRALAPFHGDAPGRRLELAIRALHSDGALPASVLERARSLARPAAPTADVYAARVAACDSLAAVLALADARPAPIHGSRRNYYRKRGEAAPVLDASGDRTARQVASAALRSVRVRDAHTALAALGVVAAVEADPAEVVPGQTVALVWTLAPNAEFSFQASGARLGEARVAVTPAAATIAAGTKLKLRTSYAPVDGINPGNAFVAAVELRLDIAGFGSLLVTDRVTLRVVAPVQADIVPVNGWLLHGDDKAVDVVVTSRAPYLLDGALTVLPTHDWKVTPARAFRFTLRRPGQTARQRLVLSLPRSAAPGTYELALRIDAAGVPVGTVRSQLVKPLRWAVAGPFAPPQGRALLGPENGVSLEHRYTGLDGGQIAWLAVPDDAYHVDGGLDLDALLPQRRGRAACACAFTVLESAEAGSVNVRVTGGDRVRWNGVAPAAGQRVRLERGQNLLLVRSCARSGEWRLSVALVDDSGAPLPVLGNDLGRLLNGYTALAAAAPVVARRGPVDRLVTLRFAGEAADVDVLGSFNAWAPLDLQRQPDGTWQRDLRLSPGRYTYKLLVDGRLRSDPGAAQSEPDGFGGHNSLLIVK